MASFALTGLALRGTPWHMERTARKSLSQPLATLAAKPASGGKIRAARIAPDETPRKRLYRFGKSRPCRYDRVGHRILANTIGNAVAYGISSSQNSAAQASATPQPTVTYTVGNTTYVQTGDTLQSTFTPPTVGSIAPDGTVQFIPGQSTIYNSDGTYSTTAVVLQVRPIDNSQNSAAVNSSPDEILITDQGLHPWLASMSNSSFYDVYQPTVDSWISARNAFEDANPGYTYSLHDNELSLAVNLDFQGSFAQIINFSPRLPDSISFNGSLSAGSTIGRAARYFNLLPTGNVAFNNALSRSGGQGSLTLSRYGDLYVSAGGIAARSSAAGASLTGNYLIYGPQGNSGDWATFVSHTPNQDQLNAVISGESYGASGAYRGVAAGLSGNNSGLMLSLGAGTRGYGVQDGTTWPLGNLSGVHW